MSYELKSIKQKTDDSKKIIDYGPLTTENRKSKTDYRRQNQTIDDRQQSTEYEKQIMDDGLQRTESGKQKNGQIH